MKVLTSKHTRKFTIHARHESFNCDTRLEVYLSSLSKVYCLHIESVLLSQSFYCLNTKIMVY